MDDEDPWAVFAQIQKFADSNRLSARTWAADEALETILDKIESGQAISTQQAADLVTNRARKIRQRGKLLAQYTIHQPGLTVREDDRLKARSELTYHQRQCFGREWRVLVSVGLGHTYNGIAEVENVPETTVKTWVRRARLKMAA